MQSNYEIVQTDTIIQMLNASNELEQNTNKWMFENERQPITEESQKSRPRIKMLAEDQKIDYTIIKNNQELFNINYSKSAYINKINSLIDTTILKKQQKQFQKNQKKLDSLDHVSQDDQILDDSNLVKLAKNRQSARDSRRRKKIYVELLEIKVQELQKQIDTLQKNLEEQNNFISHSVKIPSLISEFNLNYQKQLQSLTQLSSVREIQNFDSQFGVDSKSRECLCHTIFNTLIDHILPFDLKKIIEGAISGTGIFSKETLVANQQIQQYQLSFIDQVKKLELAIFDMAKYYECIQKEANSMEKIKYCLIESIGPQGYMENISEIYKQQQVAVKEEDQVPEKLIIS